MRYLFVLVFIFLLGSISAQIDTKKSLASLSIEEINQIFDKANNEIKNLEVIKELNNIAVQLNGSIIYSDNGEIIYQNTSGYRILNNKKRLSSKSLFDLASISKQFTAAAILKLASDDSLNLDDLIINYLPTLPYDQVTIKNLLTHTSGIPEYLDYEDFFRTDTPFTNQMLLEFFSCDITDMIAIPNDSFQYVNTNYAFLALIIESVSGQTFVDYIRSNILLPAGMTNTYFYTELSQIQNIEVCKGHLSDGSQVSDNILNSVLGDKSMFSTADDLFKWYQSYYIDYKIVPKRWIEEAITPHNRIRGVFPKELYGYGLRLEEHPLYGKLVYHGGLWRGFHHVMTYRPHDNKFILFLSNYRNRAHNGKTKLILSILDGA